ncbi:MAG: hypothetical protein J7M03_05465 [Candidatus Desulfofervidaceae bacterium]|nr:hypothetical protein [Candidatus Desulfofervidaceae bacterium]
MINEISNAIYALEEDKEVVGLVGITRGEELEDLLTDVCERLGEVAILTEGKADVELLTSIVATYIISQLNDSLEEGSKTPAQLFDEVVFPQLDNYVEAIKEEIPEDEQLTPVSE